MVENPYEPPQVHVETPVVRGGLLSWVLRIGRQLMTIGVVSMAGLVGIMGGCFILLKIAPDIRDSHYFIAAIAVCSTMGGLLVAIAANLGLNWITPRTRFWFPDEPRDSRPPRTE